MILGDLVGGLEIKSVSGDIDIEINSIAYDSRKAVKGSLFVCIDGRTVDGHKFILNALENGTKALLVQKDVDVPKSVTVIKVNDTRYALACISDVFFGHPSSKFNLIGVTGTKGKTTTTYMIKSILEKAGQNVGLIGTVANIVGSRILHAARTTPESYELQALFSEMVSKNADSVVMEVSSQGLELGRVSCCDFDIGIFTNLSRAHIGGKEHQSFEDYLNAKMMLFKMCKKGLVNIDSEYGQKVINNATCRILTFGIDKDADIKAFDVRKHADSVEFKVITPWMNGEIKVNAPGRFSVYNALAAIGACGLMGVSFECISTGLMNVSVPGRAEILDIGRDYTIMIDYAYTPDSLENILTTIKDFSTGRVVCLFGCGGDRDRMMRPMMGEISGKLADFTIITTDNPRSEEPSEIINNIEEGIKKTNGKYVKIVDRQEAIRYAIMNAKAGDLIVFAGKGHETYQEFKDKKIHFDEREVVRGILDEIKV